MLSVSFKGPRELVELHPSFIPDDPTLENYRDALEDNALVHSAVNSLKIAVATALVTTLIGLPAAYVLARQRGLLTNLGLGWILLSQMFPLILIIIPLFLLLRDLGLAELARRPRPRLRGLGAAVRPLDAAELRPRDPARPRGGGPRRRRDALPGPRSGSSRRCSLPGIVVTTLFAFIKAWNEFFLALVVLQSPDLYTLPLKLKQFVGIEGIVAARAARRRLAARDPAEPRAVRHHPALADARPALGGGEGHDERPSDEATPASGTAP